MAADPTAVLFDDVARRGREPLPGRAVGRIRFELVGDAGTDVWLVSFDKGDVSVSREDLAGECVVRTQKRQFDAIAAGEVNAMAAMLRGALTIEGDPELLVRFQRLLPARGGSDRR